MLYRLKFSRGEQVRFVSHLDAMKNWERALRRAKLPIAFSEGFNPHPKMSFGSAVGVGVTSDAEYMDLELREERDPQDILESINRVLPEGLKVLEVKELKGKVPSLMSVLNRADFMVHLPIDFALSTEELNGIIRDLLAQEQLFVEREGKKGKRQLDVRPGLYEMSGDVIPGAILLRMTLQFGSVGNIRPEEIVQVLNAQLPGEAKVQEMRVHRQGLYIAEGDKLSTPMD